MAKTKMTRTLLIINLVVFFVMTISGGTESIDNLVRFNAMVKPLVYQGQWWRVFCAQFIHIGFFHLLMNMYFLNNIGPIFEKLYGPRNFLIIYLVSGIIGNLFTYAFGSISSVSAGASTSLYGLLGLAIGIMLNYKNDEILRSFGASFISIVVINLIYSFLMPRVGVMGHLGGLIGGLVLSGVFPIVNRELSKTTISISVVLLLVLIISFIYIGNRSMRLGV